MPTFPQRGVTPATTDDLAAVIHRSGNAVEFTNAEGPEIDHPPGLRPGERMVLIVGETAITNNLAAIIHRRGLALDTAESAEIDRGDGCCRRVRLEPSYG